MIEHVESVKRVSAITTCMQDYKSPRVAVMICAILVNTQTHTHRQTAFDRLYY